MWPTTPCKGLPGHGWPWTARCPKLPSGGKKGGTNPPDRGKSGTKRSRLPDGRGVPIGLAVDGANRNDGKRTRETIEPLAVERPAPTPDTPQGLWLEKGYDDDEVRDLLEEFGCTAPIRAGGQQPRHCRKKRVSKPAAGWGSARIVGCTVFGAC